MTDLIIHPDSRSRLNKITEEYYIFDDNSKLPVYNGTPILFSSESIFSADDIINSKKTTQDYSHLDTSKFKNYVRRKLLPSLCVDYNINRRYEGLSKLLPYKSKMLIVGVGEKSSYYKMKFPDYELVTSDVHGSFNPDYIFDGHFIPFKNNCFDIVLAAQVIEHTINPWKFCTELQRITRKDGIIHIEAPQSFPYHAEPYDFFRFTYTGMRSLFPRCEVLNTEITEGNASNMAVTISNYFINLSAKRKIRSFFLILSRILFGWMKYLDNPNSIPNKRNISMPKGYAFTFKKDNLSRKPNELIKEFYSLKR